MNDLLIVAESSYLESSNATDYVHNFYNFDDTVCEGKAFSPAYFSDVEVSYDEFGIGVWTTLDTSQNMNSSG